MNSDWIPCSDRLPEQNKVVLITVKTENGNRIAADFLRNKYCWDDHCSLDVIAWMEPPEVYEEDDDKMTDYRCKDCVFRHDLKYRYSGTSKDSVSEWKYKSVCTMLIETEKSDGTFAILVENDDVCEAFCKKE